MIMEKEILDELLKRRGNKRHNFRVWNAFMEDFENSVNNLSTPY
jgi:hypothetical protein